VMNDVSRIEMGLDSRSELPGIQGPDGGAGSCAGEGRKKKMKDCPECAAWLCNEARCGCSIDEPM
jgi:hypothetical protein